MGEKRLSNLIVSLRTPKQFPFIPKSYRADFARLGNGSVPPIQDKVGQFRFLPDRTRPDTATAVGEMGSAAVKPTKAHLRGYCFYHLNLESGTIFARSVKDTSVSHSSCESEIK
eukprot:gene39174-52946_t